MLHLFSRLKKYLVLIMIILLTGCTAEYNVTINDTSHIQESLDVIETDSSLFDIKNSSLYNSTLREYLQTDLKWPTPALIDSETNPIEPTKIDGVSYYNKTDESASDALKINYKYQFNTDLFMKSKILRTCYNYEVDVKDNVLNFKTIDSLNCFEDYPLLESAKFSLKTSCKIVESNADLENGNTLTWDITKDNYSKKNIAFNLDCSKKTPKKNYKQEISIILLCFGYTAIILGVMLLIKLLYKKNNKI